MPRVLIETHGCTLNQSDSDIMETVLRNSGADVSRGEYANDTDDMYDYVIMNTCTVKKQTEQRITGRLQRFSGLGRRLIVTGCMASANSDVIRKSAPGASILSPANIMKVSEVINSDSRQERLQYSRIPKPGLIGPSGSVIARIPISEGCLSSCSFCETRFARGPLNSFDGKVILRAIQMSANAGAREIELTSQDVGAYGADSKTSIAELAMNASAIEGNFLMRIGMLNPEHLHRYFDDLIRAFNEPGSKLFRFLHLPVQSGNDRVLRDMKRRHTSGEFRSYVHELREKVRGISIATDVIVGYPTETESDYLETLNLLLELKPTITNISKFSKRPHAPASGLRQLPANEVKRRSTEMSRMVRAMQQKEYSGLAGRKMHVLVTESSGSTASGRDISYRPIGIINPEAVAPGDVVTVEATGGSYACITAKAIHKMPFASFADSANLNTLPAILQANNAGV